MSRKVSQPSLPAVFFLLLLLGVVRSSISAGEEQSCFCSVYGNTLDDCACSADNVDSFNKEIHPTLDVILKDDYFRYFQVDFNAECKWGFDLTCSSPKCAVNTCNEDSVPETVRNGSKLLGGDGDDGYLSRVLSWIFQTFPYLGHLYRDYWPVAGCSSDPYPQYHDVTQFCKLDPLTNEKCDYVDLVENPEQFTGYSGKAAHQVWNTIYDELCFHPEKDDKTLYLNTQTAKNMCLEKRTFFKLVSGLHSSIAVHLCSRYLLEEGEEPLWGRNYKEFKQRFSPESTDNEGPERIKNIYFLYLVELKALSKISRRLPELEVSDESRLLLNEFTRKISSYPHHFEESSLFKNEELNNPDLLQIFKENFMKISELMDCLGCERCKVWGKLQVTGVGTALKILLSEDSDNVSLTKHEIVALVNAFGRHSTSVRELEYFKEANL